MHTAPKATFIGGARQVVTYLFRELPVPVAHGSHPLLVVRGDDREVSAFLDVCRHRGTRSEDAPCGHEKKAFVCPYHAWSYAGDGHLLGIPHDEGFAGIDRSGRPSRAASEAEARLDARAWLGPLADDLESIGLASSHVHAPRTFTRALHWKLAIDVFLEAYHLRMAHKKAVYPIFFDKLGLSIRSARTCGTSSRSAPSRRSPRLGANEEEVVFGAFEHGNAHFHAEIARRIG